MFVSMFHVPLSEAEREEFERRFAARAGLVDRMPGFRGLEMLWNVEKPEYVVLTRWDTREDYERWLHSPAFAMGHQGQPYDPAEAEGLVDMYEVVTL